MDTVRDSAQAPAGATRVDREIMEGKRRARIEDEEPSVSRQCKAASTRVLNSAGEPVQDVDPGDYI